MIAAIRIASSDENLVAALLAADLPIDDLEDSGRWFFRVESAGRTIGFGGFELYGEDGLLRSVVVSAVDRGQGHGRLVVETMLREIEHAGGRRVYLLTTSATAFFLHLGFTRIARAAAPPSILATRQASTICASAELMTRAI